ncbi:ABC transporter permease [Clostridium cellulovorans]|uniref:ABC-2 family transporter protein n=1 Tax=Clostridium cellulovorans (strain ATCC 35296 / DSM 3052 / OCM 3 / 743B) TaxID=573061 RepID=D9SN89_CLOC7|nr:ABC transporter permease [Clostridium cellulovorans]ADL53881.1 hypothetical protein Clocel_4220 [Clostridium cellulovorans 743B]
MLNYIKGEIYKVIKRPYLFVITFALGIGCLFIGGVLPKLLMAESILNLTRYGILSISNLLVIGINAILLIFLPIFTEDFRNKTFKNLVNVNLSRKQMFLAKYIVQLIMAVIMAIILFLFLGVAIQMLPPGEGYSNSMFIGFFIKLFSTIPCFATGIAIIDLLAILVKKEILICVIYYYGYIQIYAIIMFMLYRSSNTILRVIFMPAQIGNLFYNEFSVSACLLTAITGLVYSTLLVFNLNLMAKKAEIY